MARAADLDGQARQFASSLQHLLNRTICYNAKVLARVVPSQRDLVVVGTQLDATLIAHPVGVTISAKKPTAWLDVEYQCFLDQDAYLTVVQSYYAIYDADGETRLCHYDFDRNKERYAKAHLQVDGHSPALGKLPGPRKAQDLEKLHFPVGGHRYRPCLEDLVEFMVTEGFAAARDGWQQVVDEERKVFLARQLKAAVRRDPETARAALRDVDKAAGRATGKR